MSEKIVVLTGAGMSAESGIQTFRDADGLWENHRVEDVASPDGWHRDRKLVLDFYNARRAQLKDVQPNKGHLDLVKLEEQHEVVIITQNVDDLHERAGSKNIIHLHGQLKKVRSIASEHLVYDWDKDLNEGDLAEDGQQLRPDIVWFGEAVPMLEKAAHEVMTASMVVIIGTSMQVYPAAGLVGYAPPFAPIYYIDPNPKMNFKLQVAKNVTVIDKVATEGVNILLSELL